MGKEMGSLRRKGNIPQHPEAWKIARLQVGLVGFWAWREGWGPCLGQMNVWGHTGFFVIGNSVSALCVPQRAPRGSKDDLIYFVPCVSCYI